MPKVLLVEDDEYILSLLHTLLQIEGYETISAGRDFKAESLMHTLRQEKPALILMDVNLHRSNGFDILRSIRSDENLKSVRILMSSGMDCTIRCYREGADGFILKPYMPDELISKIKYLTGT